jgi:predicted phosphodiesterase
MGLKELDDRRIVEVVNHALQNGDAASSEAFSITPESLARYKREFRTRFGDFDRRVVLEKIASNYSTDELKAIAAGSLGGLGSKKHVATRTGDVIKFGVMTDTHIGSVYFRPEYFEEAIDTMQNEECQFICHCGDITEGFSNRPGHVYELSHIGYKRQKDYAIEMLSKWDGQWYTISGNHDRWYMKSAGADMVEDISEAIGATYLGHDEGDIIIGDTIIKLWHGEDAGSYAHSYRLQKLIESFAGGSKPHILLCGHTHKQGYFFDRNIHVISGGALSLQSKWMRSKRLAHHSGYWIVTAYSTDDGVTRFIPEWYPFF